MIENIVEISKEQLLAQVQEMFYEGYRFVTATCVDLGDGKADILYHFDKDLEIRNFRLTMEKSDVLPSISKIYFCAVLVENEMKELFGLKINDIAIDYDGRMLLADDSPDAPMAKRQIIIEKRESAGQ